jgi:hypothetical protein
VLLLTVVWGGGGRVDRRVVYYCRDLIILHRLLGGSTEFFSIEEGCVRGALATGGPPGSTGGYRTLDPSPIHYKNKNGLAGG